MPGKSVYVAGLKVAEAPIVILELTLQEEVRLGVRRIVVGGRVFVGIVPIAGATARRNLMIGDVKTCLFLLPALVATMMAADAQPAPDARVADLVRAGKVRAALFLPQFTRDVVTGGIRGDVHLVDTAQALATRLGVELMLVDYPTPTKAIEGLKAGLCDVAFLGIDPSRAIDVGVSPQFAELDYTYLVPAGSSIRVLADADRLGARIAAVRNHASTVALSGLVKHATLIYADTPEPTFDLLRTGQADAMASVAYALAAYSTQLPGSRVF